MALGEISGFQQRLLNLELSRDIALPFWVSGSSSLLGTMKHFLRLVEISIKKKKNRVGGKLQGMVYAILPFFLSSERNENVMG